MVPTLPRRIILTALPAAAALAATPAQASSAREIDRQAGTALAQLYASNAKAKRVGARARAMLIFPRIVRAGLIIGGQSGDGVLRVGGRANGFYNISAASFGLQAGAQAFSYAMFFMTQGALDHLMRNDGWAIGSGPTVVVIDQGAAAAFNTTTLNQDVYAFPFGARGLMAGIGLEGSKISRINPGP